MIPLDDVFGLEQNFHPLRDEFMRWQCRVRQISMRDHYGKPGDGILAEVTPRGASGPIGNIITVLNKAAAYSKTPELKHMYLRTNDPAQRREKALQLFSETYYQKQKEFSDILTATFQPESKGCQTILDAGECTLGFEAYSQQYRLKCSVKELDSGNSAYQATYWHNLLFNPHLSPDTRILGFKPDWEKSSEDTMPNGG